MTDYQDLKEQVILALTDLLDVFPMNDRHILVFGVSTSEVIGHKIGSSGSEEIANAIFEGIKIVRADKGFHLAFQGCEHINRALVVERETAEKFNLDIVSVIPIKKAGGAMATYAYHQMKEPVVVEFIKADAGIDIGDTLIGMHLKHVAVPVRSKVKKIGFANVIMAKTRPKLIGGARAQYITEETPIKDNLLKVENVDAESC